MPISNYISMHKAILTQYGNNNPFGSKTQHIKLLC